MRTKSTITVPERHQLKIARDTMKTICSFTGVMGMTHREAARIIAKLGGRPINVAGCYCKPSKATIACYCPDSHAIDCDCRRRPVTS